MEDHRLGDLPMEGRRSGDLLMEDRRLEGRSEDRPLELLPQLELWARHLAFRHWADHLFRQLRQQYQTLLQVFEDNQNGPFQLHLRLLQSP